MAYTAGNLHLRAGGVGKLEYIFDALTDTMATVIAAGYFNNSDDDLNLQAGDMIFCQCADGNMMLKVSAVSAAGVVTTQFAGGDMPINSAQGTASGALSVGFTEVNSGTGSAYVLPTPYAGAHLAVQKTGTATAGKSFITDDAGVTLNEQGDRTIVIENEGEGFHLVGASATRWHIRQVTMASNGLS